MSQVVILTSENRLIYNDIVSDNDAYLNESLTDFLAIQGVDTIHIEGNKCLTGDRVYLAKYPKDLEKV